jgi:endo-1,4-beta-xylanase
MFEAAGDTLREVAAATGRWIGTAVDDRALREDPRYGPTVAAEFDTITPENAMKWAAVHPEPEVWTFGPADEVMAFAARHALRVRGHTLVWHRQLASWVTDGLTAEELRREVVAHIHRLLARYRGRVAAWDVVNEAVEDSGECLRDSVFLRALGPAYIALAFAAARAADPHALRFYNEYGAEGMNAKSDLVYDLLSGLLREGVPIDGVGLQMHVGVGAHPPGDEIGANVARLAALGLRVAITEMDVSVRNVAGNRLTAQRDAYHEILGAGAAGCHGVSFWGFTDRHTWLAGDAPLLLDEQYRRKPAYLGARDALRAP